MYPRRRRFIWSRQKTGDGVEIKLGDTVVVDEFQTVVAKVTNIWQDRNNRVITIEAVDKMGEDYAYPSSIVRRKDDPTDPYGGFDFNLFVESGIFTEGEASDLKIQMEKDPTMLDSITTPQKGTIRLGTT